MTQVYQTRSKVIDGHFWLEDCYGVIVEATPLPNVAPYNIEPKYYKKASESIQKMVIEMTYRKFEAQAKCSRDSQRWKYDILTHNYTPGACFHNCLKALLKKENTTGLKMVFGYLGIYHHRASQGYPKNSVYWLYGSSKYSTIKEIFNYTDSTEFDDYWTYENWEDRDNKEGVAGWRVKK